MATATGATLSVVKVTTDVPPADDSAWKALSYVLVGEVATISALGDTNERITFTDLQSGRVNSVHGTKDGGELSVAVNTEQQNDNGQQLVRAAVSDGSLLAVRIQDPGTGADGKYFLARAANYMESERSPSVNQGSTFTLWRITDIESIS